MANDKQLKKFLIQKRSKIKNGKYATTGGHPKSGENSVQGIISEVKEEIGLELKPHDIQLYYTGRSDSERVFWDDYYIKIDIDDTNNLTLQKEEVERKIMLKYINDFDDVLDGIIKD